MNINTMSSPQCYIMKIQNHVMGSTEGESKDAKPPTTKEKVKSYEEKTVGSTQFFKCEACPYMALAEDDIKFHLFTVHPDLAKSNGLADNIQINCPGCTSIFDAEETLRNHLRNHHKMGIKDIKKMVKSLIQIALKDAKLKKEEPQPEPQPPVQARQEIPDVKIPQVIEIISDVNANNQSLPTGVAFISVEELNKMSTPNFEKIDPKNIIEEASINIVYTDEITGQFVNVSNVSSVPTTSANSNVLRVSNVAPDLISSIPTHTTAVIDNSNILSPKQTTDNSPDTDTDVTEVDLTDIEDPVKKYGELCQVDNCYCRLKDVEKLSYHRKCHQNGKLTCPECTKVFKKTEALHTHLWKEHAIDLELPTCEICGYKTFKKYRMVNIHMKCHGKLKAYACQVCSKSFKTRNQLEKHRIIHKNEPVTCPLCNLQLSCNRRLQSHITAVHDKIRPFKCTICTYSSTRKEEMKLHMRSHTGDKPYKCEKCPYRSADNNAMRRHKRMHEKEVVYRCKICPFSTIQSTNFTNHMLKNHSDVENNDIHRCAFCKFKTVNKQKYMVHLSTHPDKQDITLPNVSMMMNSGVKNKTPWTIPSVNNDEHSNKEVPNEQNIEPEKRDDTSIDVDKYDCDSISATMPQDYSKNFTIASSNAQDSINQATAQDFRKDGINSDCLLAENSSDTMFPQTPLPLQMIYESPQPNLHNFLNTSVSLEPNLLQSSGVTSLVTSHSPIASNISNNIMCNFPIRLPHLPPTPYITLKTVDKISIPLTTKVTGPIIKPTQILPVPSSSNSPVNISLNDLEGVPRKKPKISVKSNLILKGPDQVNMFHSQQKMAFKQLEDNERYGLGGPVTFNNLITTQFMQLPPEPVLSESPSNIMPYPQKTIKSVTPPVDNEINDSSQIFTFNQMTNVTQMTLVPPSPKIQTNNPNYIKLESSIKQNTQSPSLERMCNADLINRQPISREYKASPPLEDIHKNINDIKNEVRVDAYYNMRLNNNASNSILDQFLIDNIMGEQYSSGHLDLSTVGLPEAPHSQQNDVIEIDDNSDDNKLLPRFDMNFPLESLYLMHNDFHFLENEVPANNIPNEVSEINRMVSEVPITTQKETLDILEGTNDFTNFIQGKKDPMMNTSVRPTTNKINVKNIELMKN